MKWIFSRVTPGIGEQQRRDVAADGDDRIEPAEQHRVGAADQPRRQRRRFRKPGRLQRLGIEIVDQSTVAAPRSFAASMTP